MAPNHSNTARSQTARATRQLRAMLTRDPAWVREAQRLRHDVFAAEYGASFGSSEPGIDADPFDPFCEHLMVVDHYNGQLVATTRLLHQDDAQAAGGFYSESEFDLSNLYTLPGKIVEMGRTCVHPDYQNGATMAVLWAGLAEYLKTLDIGFLIGCASIHIQDSGQRAWRIARELQNLYLCDPQWRVTPRRALPHLAGIQDETRTEIPALIKAYMRLGARVCGEPCWDPDFRCADMLVLLDVNQLTERYARHFMRRDGRE